MDKILRAHSRQLKLIRGILPACFLYLCTSFLLCSDPASAGPILDEPGGTAESIQLATLDPDEYAWTLFKFICRQAQTGVPGKVSTSHGSLKTYERDRDVVWETWALATHDGKPESEIFLEDGKRPPVWGQWNRPKAQDKLLDRNFLAEFIHEADHELQDLNSRREDKGTKDVEIRMNREAYDFIRDNKLYSQEGLAWAYSEAVKDGNLDIIQFPIKSKIIKAKWEKIEASEGNKARYHWRLIDGEPYGLIALHIVTKDLPMWFWTDFLHVDKAQKEPKDSFRDSTTRGPNAPCGQNGVRKETLGTKWEHYRLKGTQIAFVNARGQETILGNQELEFGKAAISSCITCHAAARVDKQGSGKGIFVNFPRGAPATKEFIENGRMKFLQTDFVYILGTRAHSEGSRPAP